MSLPLPPSWRSDPRPRWWHPLMFAGIGAAVLVAAVGSGESAARAAGHAVFACGLGVQFLPRRGLGRESRDGALVVLASPLRTVAPAVGLMVHGVGYVTLAGWPWGVVVLALYAVAIAAIFRRVGLPGHLRLDPQGVSLPRKRLSWDAADVVARSRGRVYVGGVRVLVARYADPVALYWTLRYYAEHPGARDELADGRALDRVRRAHESPMLLGIAPSMAMA